MIFRRLTAAIAAVAALACLTGPALAAEREVSVPVDEATTLAGTLRLPDGPARAGVLMLTGNGHHVRDQMISGSPMFGQIAEALAERGVATLRLDAAGAGQSTGARTAHFGERAPQMAAAVDLLARQPELAGVPLGLLGHSEGAMVASLVYADRPQSVDFLILLSAPGARGDVVWVEQQAGFAPERFPNMPEGGLPAVRAALQAVTVASIRGDRDAVAEASLGFARAIGAPQEDIDNGELEPFIERMASAEMQTFLSHDPAPAFSAVAAPVLAVWGGIDVHTAPGVNAGPLIAARHPDSVLTTVVLPAQDHFFMVGDGLAPGEHARGRMRVSEALIEVIDVWLPTVTE